MSTRSEVSTSSELTVVDVPEFSRFELLLGEERVGLADYFVANDVMTVPHVETEPMHR